MMCTVCYTIWFPILACWSSWHYTFTTRQCFQDCLLRLHIRYSEGRQNPNIAPNSTQEVKEIQILSSIVLRWQTDQILLQTTLGGQTKSKYCPKQYAEDKRDPNIVFNSTKRIDTLNIARKNSQSRSLTKFDIIDIAKTPVQLRHCTKSLMLNQILTVNVKF